MQIFIINIFISNVVIGILNPGVVLALFGALILTPDTLLMRLSELSGGQMVAWRATQAGSIFFLIGLIPIYFIKKWGKTKNMA